MKVKFKSLIFQIKHPALSSFHYHLSINYSFCKHTRLAQIYQGLGGKLGCSPESPPYQVRPCLFSHDKSEGSKDPSFSHCTHQGDLALWS